MLYKREEEKEKKTQQHNPEVNSLLKDSVSRRRVISCCPFSDMFCLATKSVPDPSLLKGKKRDRQRRDSHVSLPPSNSL